MNSEIDLSKIKLIVGLGNIGEQYALSRHNAGFLFLDEIAHNPFNEDSKRKAMISKLKLGESQALLAKPTTMMNRSGDSVRSILDYYNIKPREILVAFDDLDIELGKSKIQFAKGPKIHNGLNDIEKKLGTNKFWRFRIGVDSRTKEERAHIAPNEYVLKRMNPEELLLLKKSF